MWSINTLKEVFSDPHVKAREMVIEMDHKKTGNAPLKLIVIIKMEDTPPSYRLSPPILGEHTDNFVTIIRVVWGEIKKLKDEGIV